jgi:hypothetical protein
MFYTEQLTPQSETVADLTILRGAAANIVSVT